MAQVIKKLVNGTEVPLLAFGTGSALYRKDATDAVSTAIKVGFTHIDTAAMYGNEESVGRALAATPRSKLFVTTKIQNSELNAGETVRDCLKKSLARLQVDYVDLYLIHTPIGIETKLPEIWKQFEGVQKEGLARSIGVSNFRVKDFEFLKNATIIPAVNQIEYHPYVHAATMPLLELHREYGIITASYGGQTPITKKKGAMLDSVLASIRQRLERDRGKPVTDGQVLFKWLGAKGIPAVTTSSKEERLREYLEVPEIPNLTVEEVDAIDKAGSETHYRYYQRHMDT